MVMDILNVQQCWIHLSSIYDAYDDNDNDDDGDFYSQGYHLLNS